MLEISTHAERHIQQIREIKHGAAVTALAVRGDGLQLASAGADNLIGTVWGRGYMIQTEV